MEYVIVCLAALTASALTLFSGFGLGTMLTPVFALFFPIEVAVAQTALVHFANNLFKVVNFGRHANVKAVLLFGLPAMLAALAGARLLTGLADMAPLFTWSGHSVTPVKLVVGLLMIGFAVLEMLPARKEWAFDSRWLPVGGFVSGFFGGLSGHQGAFRSAFLVRLGLPKETFVATGVILACLVDFTRLAVYSGHLDSPQVAASAGLIVAATLAAFAGVILSRKFLHKMTVGAIRATVALMLGFVGLLLVVGLI